jgi:hypothetical protein
MGTELTICSSIAASGLVLSRRCNGSFDCIPKGRQAGLDKTKVAFQGDICAGNIENSRYLHGSHWWYIGVLRYFIKGQIAGWVIFSSCICSWNIGGSPQPTYSSDCLNFSLFFLISHIYKT